MTTHIPSGMHFKSINFTGPAPGPSLIVLGAVHGNETCGTKAILRVLDEIEGQGLVIKAGSVTFVPTANPLAYARGQRIGDRNLNRNLYPNQHPKDFEDHIANWLCPLLARHEVLLDLHSFNAHSQPFALLGPQDNAGALQAFDQSAKEKALALRLGVRRFVDGWLDTYALGVERRVREAAASGRVSNSLNTDARYGVGTTEYMRSVGGYAVTLECGQHQDPLAPEVGYRAICNTLTHLGLIDGPAPEPVEKFEALRLYEVIDKEHAADTFSRAWSSFDRVTKGDLIGTRQDGTPVIAERDSAILFPDAKAAEGNEWFYLASVNAEF